MLNAVLHCVIVKNVKVLLKKHYKMLRFIIKKYHKTLFYSHV